MSSRKQINPEETMVPAYFFGNKYQIDRNLLQLQSPEDIKPYIEKY